METFEVEVWVVVGDDGQYGIGADSDAAREDYSENVGGAGPMRELCVTLTVPRPVAVMLAGRVPAESTKGVSLTVA